MRNSYFLCGMIVLLLMIVVGCGQVENSGNVVNTPPTTQVYTPPKPFQVIDFNHVKTIDISVNTPEFIVDASKLTNDTQSDKKTSEVLGTGEVDEDYTGLDGLVQASQLIAVVTPQQTKQQVSFQGATFDVYRLHLDQIIARNEQVTKLANVGAEIKLLAVGAFQPNQKYLLFLKKYEGPVINEDAFVVVGAFQGQFLVDGEDSLSYVANNEGNPFQNKLAAQGLKKFVQEIQYASKNKPSSSNLP
jgi:hypothetical protein